MAGDWFSMISLPIEHIKSNLVILLTGSMS